MPIVDKQSYIPNTLRKNRPQAFQLDIQTIYLHYHESIKSLTLQQFTITTFTDIWTSYNMQYIFQCLSQQQNQQQFAQMMYEVVFKKYFIYKDKEMKIFALFALYFLYYACENRKRINICPMYASQMKKFILENRNDKSSHYMKIAYQLHQKCFNFCTKIGLEDPIVKGNGDIPRKNVIVRVDPLVEINTIEQQFRQYKQDNGNSNSNSNNNGNNSYLNTIINNPISNSDSNNKNINTNVNKMGLKDSLINYDKLKKQLFKDNTVNKDKFPVDNYFVNRIEKMVKNYKQFVQNTEKSKKKQQQSQ